MGQTEKNIFFYGNDIPKEKKLEGSRMRNVWKTRTRLERGSRDVINCFCIVEQNLFEKLDHLDARPAGDSPLAVAEVTELLGEARARVDEPADP